MTLIEDFRYRSRLETCKNESSREGDTIEPASDETEEAELKRALHGANAVSFSFMLPSRSEKPTKPLHSLHGPAGGT